MYHTATTFLSPDQKMSEVIQQNPYLLLLLEHFGITIPLQEKSIQQVCEETNLNTDLFLIFANLYNGIEYKPTAPLSFKNADTIINYLKNSHLLYSKEIYPTILDTIKQMTEVNNHKEMALVEKFFVDYFNEVKEHLDYENKVVFPYVLHLHEQIKQSKTEKRKTQYSVLEYKEHHNDIEEKLNDLKNLLIKYLPQKNDQVLRRNLLFSLFELEFDLNIHSKIEDLILIPLVTKMEEHLKNANK